MGDFLNIKSDGFLGGKNVHSVLILAGVAFLVYKAVK